MIGRPSLCLQYSYLRKGQFYVRELLRMNVNTNKERLLFKAIYKILKQNKKLKYYLIRSREEN